MSTSGASTGVKPKDTLSAESSCYGCVGATLAGPTPSMVVVPVGTVVCASGSDLSMPRSVHTFGVTEITITAVPGGGSNAAPTSIYYSACTTVSYPVLVASA